MATLGEAKAIGATALVLLLIGSVANASSVLSIVALILGASYCLHSCSKQLMIARFQLQINPSNEQIYY